MSNLLGAFRISAKIVFIVVAISLVGLGVAFFSTRVIMSADTAYSDLLSNDSRATVFMARISRNANRIGYAAYRNIASNQDAKTSRESADLIHSSYIEAVNFLKEAESMLPGDLGAINGFEKDLTAIDEVVEKAVAEDLAGNEAGAEALLASVDPKIVELAAAVGKFNDGVIARVLARSDELTAEAESFSTTILAGTVAAAVLAMIGALMISSKGITGPLNRLRERMEALASGRLDVEVEGQTRKDEVGAMARTVQVFKEAGLANKRLEDEAVAARTAQSEQRDRQSAIDNSKAEDLKLFVHAVERGFTGLSEGDLTVRMNGAVAPEFEPIRVKFNDSVGSLDAAIGSVVTAVGAIRVGLNEISVASNDLAQRTEQQAASLEETVAALSEVTRGVNETAEGAGRAQGASSVAQKNAERGGEIVTRAVAAMGEIEKSSDQIGKIIGVIDEIAFQTNLLALNAGVEAARAGEAGRGFAVVAQEVRGLAQRSAEAAKEIKNLISTSGTHVGQGVELVTASGRSLEEIVAQVGDMSAVVSEIARGAREQATSLKEVSAAADQMDKVTQQNAAMVEETTAAAQTLTSETEELAVMVERFTTSAGSPARSSAPARRPAADAARNRPAVTQMKTTGHGGAARKPAAESSAWEEF